MRGYFEGPLQAWHGKNLLFAIELGSSTYGLSPFGWVALGMWPPRYSPTLIEALSCRFAISRGVIAFFFLRRAPFALGITPWLVNFGHSSSRSFHLSQIPSGCFALQVLLQRLVSAAACLLLGFCALCGRGRGRPRKCSALCRRPWLLDSLHIHFG